MKISTNWTPGPWSYSFAPPTDDWGEVRNQDRQLVAKCWLSRWSPEQLNEHRAAKTDPAAANAHLIAAAPELYESLEGLLDDFVDDLLVCGYDEGDIDDHSKVKAARAALAKARGEP